MPAKIPVTLALYEWSVTIDYLQVTETLNLVSFYKKSPERIPLKYHKKIESWLASDNLSKFLAYKEEAEKHQMRLTISSFTKQLRDQ